MTAGTVTALQITFFTVVVCLLTACQHLPSSPQLSAAPMPGYSAQRAVKVWVQTQQPAVVALRYWPASARQSNQAQTTAAVTTHALTHTAVVDVVNLQPGTRYTYEVLVNGKSQPALYPQYFTTQSLWQWRTDPPDFRIALGSCAYINQAEYDRPSRPYGAGYAIFNQIAEREPDMMLWLGDNTYLREADYDSRWGINARYQHDRKLPELQRLLSATHHYATWDDHDYGYNNDNASYIYKNTALDMFKQYWANPSYGLSETPGVFTHFNFNDVDFFLVDGRYYRDDDKLQSPINTPKTMLGSVQTRWLKNALLRSTATFKIIAGGSQFLNIPLETDGWHHYPQRQVFLDWLAQSDIDGVLFISGDRHHSELLKVTRPETYDLYELTCSPLTSGAHNVNQYERDNPRRVPDTLVEQRNFCQLDVTGSRKQRALTISVNNTQGQPLWQQTIRAADLQTPAQE